jgi:ABC-type multidrug transport system ATPase subunit
MRIAVEHLSKKFGDFAALTDVSFNVQPGETFALLGPNGSGKTTALKCLVGLTIPTAGTIAVGNFDLRTQPRAAKQLMSYLPQRVAFHDQLTAREVLQFYSRLRKLPRCRIDETLNTPNFHFNGFSDKAVGQFSGGMLQRLGLAVACLPNAPVLVLDEPTMSLDPEGAIQFREFLASLKREGKTIIFSSHVLADVEQLADRVAILVGGRLVALESVTALRDQVTRTARMRISLKHARADLIEVARQVGASAASLDEASLLVNSRPGDRLEILRALESAGAGVIDFATEDLSLEEVYMSYVRGGTVSTQTAPKERNAYSPRT